MLTKVVHGCCVALALLIVGVAAPSAMGVGEAEAGPVARQEDSAGGHGARYVFLGGFSGGK